MPGAPAPAFIAPAPATDPTSVPVPGVDAGAGAWHVRGRVLALDRPLVMGILNVTPDSFSDGGRFLDPDAAVRRAREMAAAGADLIDLGGESTRPGAAEVTADEEAARVVPVLRALRHALDVPLSVDTRKAAVARAALDAGAHVVNDVSGLGDPGMAATVAAWGAGLVLMHMRGTPATMQSRADYADVVDEVAAELAASLARADAAGVARERVVLDPGIGFAKTADHNWALLGALPRLAALGHPLLLGVSRKSFLGALLADGSGAPRPVEQREDATTALSALAAAAGVWGVRVHEVAASLDAVRVGARWAAARAVDDPGGGVR